MPGDAIKVLRAPKKNEKAVLYTGVNRNDDFEFTVKKAGVVQDISSFTIKAILKPSEKSDDADAITNPLIISGVLSDPTNGKFKIPWTTTEITTKQHQAFLVIYREVGGTPDKQIMSQFHIDTINSGVD